jgi:hypothetical protein
LAEDAGVGEELTDFRGVTCLQGLTKISRLLLGGAEASDDVRGVSHEDADPKVFFAGGDTGRVF